MTKSRKENKFCKQCGLEIKHNDIESIEYHQDICGRANIVCRNEVKIEGIDKDYENNKDERKDNKKLFDHALKKISHLVISENNSDEVFAVVKRGKSTDVFKIPSRRFRDWLCNEFLLFINSDEIKSDEFFKSVANSIYSYARMNDIKTAKIYNRIAQLDDEIW